jgi:hypothetical protein
MSDEETNKILVLPDGRFELSSRPGFALSESQAIAKMISEGIEPDIARDLIRRAKVTFKR